VKEANHAPASVAIGGRPDTTLRFVSVIVAGIKEALLFKDVGFYPQGVETFGFISY